MVTTSSTGSHSSAPGYEVTVGSRKFSQPSTDGMEILIIEDHVDMVDMLTLRVTASEGTPEWAFKIGDPVEALVGAGSEAFFKGEVTALEPSFQVEDPGATINVRALDHMHRLGRGRKTRFWENKMESDVVKEVAEECGLSVQADATTEVLPYILQRNESNVAFCKRLAARNNFILSVEDQSLSFKKASYQGSSKVVTLGDNLRSARLSFNSVDMVQQVVVRGWDIKAKKEIVGTASSGNVTQIGGGTLGLDEAASFGSSVGYITDVPVSSQGLANEIAKAELERIARQFCHGACTISGDDTVRAGTMVELGGMAAPYNGKYFVISTRHIVSSRTGYVTELTFCSNSYGS